MSTLAVHPPSRRVPRVRSTASALTPWKKNQTDFDAMIKAARLACIGQKLLVDNNPILAHILRHTNNNNGGPWPPTKLMLDAQTINHKQIQLLTHILTHKTTQVYRTWCQTEIKGYTGVMQLQCWGTPIGDDGVATLMTAIHCLPNLHTLIFYNCQLTALSCGHLSKSWNQTLHKQVKSLTLDCNQITPQGMHTLAQGLTSKHNSTLHTLTLNFCQIDIHTDREETEVAESITRLLNNSILCLQSLGLEGNRLGNTVLFTLSQILSHNHTLHTLNLANTKIHYAYTNTQDPQHYMLLAFIDTIQSNSTLTAVNLDSNILSDTAVSMIVPMLLDCTHLLQFDISPLCEPILWRQLRDRIKRNKAAVIKKKPVKVKKKKVRRKVKSKAR